MAITFSNSQTWWRRATMHSRQNTRWISAWPLIQPTVSGRRKLTRRRKKNGELGRSEPGLLKVRTKEVAEELEVPEGMAQNVPGAFSPWPCAAGVGWNPLADDCSWSPLQSNFWAPQPEHLLQAWSAPSTQEIPPRPPRALGSLVCACCFPRRSSQKRRKWVLRKTRCFWTAATLSS